MHNENETLKALYVEFDDNVRDPLSKLVLVSTLLSTGGEEIIDGSWGSNISFHIANGLADILDEAARAMVDFGEKLKSFCDGKEVTP